MITPMKHTTYLAGPMTGIKNYNFQAFDEAEDNLRNIGWEVISPAAMDREIGFDPEIDVPDQKFIDDAMTRDFNAIMRADSVTLLPGWQDSTGATAEMWLARWRQIPIYLYPWLEELDCTKSDGKRPKTHIPAQVGMVPRVYDMINRCVEDGVQYGYNRAHKHTSTPDEFSIRDAIGNAVMNEICEWFDFPERVED